MEYKDIFGIIERLRTELSEHCAPTGLEGDSEPFLVDVEPYSALILVMDSARENNMQVTSSLFVEIEDWCISFDLTDDEFLEFKEHQQALRSST